MVTPNGRLLVVDDIEDIRSVLVRRFQRHGFEVTEADGGQAALELLARRPFDLMLLDIVMPDLDGLEVLTRVRAERSAVALPVIMVTAKAQGEDIVRALGLGANDYVTKPFDFAVALARVQAHISHKRSHEALLDAMHEAEAASRAKSAFLASMSHELRTPLNAIIGFTQLLRDRQVGAAVTAEDCEYAATAHDSGVHLLDIVSNLLELTTAEAGGMRLQEDGIDVASMVTAVLRRLRPQLEARGVCLDLRLEPDLPLVTADEKLLQRALGGIVGNAIKFNREGGQVAVAAAITATGELELRITDTGIGIAPEHLSRIVQPFTPADGSLARRYDGLGLGLPLARTLVELHGGRLELTSTPDIGTTVSVVLPAQRLMMRDAIAPSAAA